METPYYTFKQLLEEHNQELSDKFFLLVPYGYSLSKEEKEILQATANRARAIHDRKRFL